MNYSLFSAICELELVRALAPLHGHTETTVWRQMKVDLRTFRRQEIFFNVLLYMK